MNESALLELPGGRMWTRLGLEIEKPQMNANERGFVNLNIQHLSEVFPENYLINSTQIAQSSEITTPMYTPSSRRGTRMTRIGRIFTDPCASVSSAQSVFYRNPSGASAFIRVHPRLIFLQGDAGERRAGSMNESALPELSGGWVWTRLGEIGTINPKLNGDTIGDLRECNEF